jgi:mRNA-degrading endonuclease RelE of RelBE toxin-antitoxin system
LADGPWRVEYLDVVAEDDMPALPKTARLAIKRAIETRLAVDPVAYGKPLRYSLTGHRRLRVGDYRIVYRVDSRRRAVVISVIKHRKDVYES